MNSTPTVELNIDIRILNQCVKKELNLEVLTIVEWRVNSLLTNY